jgi:hypothetical protein
MRVGQLQVGYSLIVLKNAMDYAGKVV